MAGRTSLKNFCLLTQNCMSKTQNCTYKTRSVNGFSKTVFSVFGPQNLKYYGNSKGTQWEFSTKQRARKWAKSEKLKGFEIHRLETVTLFKEVEVV